MGREGGLQRVTFGDNCNHKESLMGEISLVLIPDNMNVVYTHPSWCLLNYKYTNIHTYIHKHKQHAITHYIIFNDLTMTDC